VTTTYNFASTLSVRRPNTVQLAPGAPPVAQPARANQCWGLIAEPDGSHRTCRARARGHGGTAEKLTCQSHRKLEESAQALRASLQEQTQEAANG
jgi:hypothetical protein